MVNKIQIVIETVANTKAGVDAIKTQLGGVKDAAVSLKNAFFDVKTAIIGLAGGLAGRALAREIWEYNSALEISKLGISAIITSMAEVRDGQGRVLHGQEKWNAATEIAVEAQRALQKIGMTTAATYSELVEVYQGILAPALGAKMTLAETLEITGLLTNSVKSIGLNFNQIKQEARDLVQGGIQPASSSLAIALNINDADVKLWREKGTLFKELKSRLEGFAYASREFENTWEGAWSNFKDIVRRALGEGFQSTFATFKGFIKSISDGLVIIERDINGVITKIEIRPEVLQSFREWSLIIGEVAMGLKNAARDIASIISMIPGVSGSKRAISTMGYWKEVMGGVEGMSLERPSPQEIQLLMNRFSSDKTAAAFRAGLIKQVMRRQKSGILAAEWGLEYNVEEINSYFSAIQALQEKGKKYDVKGGATGAKDDKSAAKKGQKAVEQLTGAIARLKVELGELSAAEYIEMEAAKKLAETKDNAAVAEWKRLEMLKLEREEEERSAKTAEEAEKVRKEALEERYSLQQKLLEVEKELWEGSLKGNEDAIEVIKKRYEWERRLLEAERDRLVAQGYGLGVERDELSVVNAKLAGLGARESGEISRYLEKEKDPAGKKADELGKEIGNSLRRGMEDLFYDPLHTSWQSLWESLRRAAAKSMADMVMDWFEAQAKMTSGSGGAGGILGMLAALFGMGAGPGGQNMALGNQVDMFSFHTGGAGNEGRRRPVFVIPSYLPRAHTGLGPKERVTVTLDDETIFTAGQTRALGLMARSRQDQPPVNITINALDAANVAQWAYNNKDTLAYAGIAAARGNHPSRRRR